MLPSLCLERMRHTCMHSLRICACMRMHAHTHARTPTHAHTHTHGRPCTVCAHHDRAATACGGARTQGLALSSSNSAKLNELQAHPDVSVHWGAEDTGLCWITYTARVAGTMDLTLWSEAAEGRREPLPGSPFALQVAAGEAMAERSYIDGYVCEQAKRDKGASGGNAKAASPNTKAKLGGAEADSETEISAGDAVVVRAYVCAAHLRHRPNAMTLAQIRSTRLGACGVRRAAPQPTAHAFQVAHGCPPTPPPRRRAPMRRSASTSLTTQRPPSPRAT